LVIFTQTTFIHIASSQVLLSHASIALSLFTPAAIAEPIVITGLACAHPRILTPASRHSRICRLDPQPRGSPLFPCYLQDSCRQCKSLGSVVALLFCCHPALFAYCSSALLPQPAQPNCEPDPPHLERCLSLPSRFLSVLHHTRHLISSCETFYNLQKWCPTRLMRSVSPCCKTRPSMMKRGQTSWRSCSRRKQR
jgi:hypothetical protein